MANNSVTPFHSPKLNQSLLFCLVSKQPPGQWIRCWQLKSIAKYSNPLACKNSTRLGNSNQNQSKCHQFFVHFFCPSYVRRCQRELSTALQFIESYGVYPNNLILEFRQVNCVLHFNGLLHPFNPPRPNLKIDCK